MCQQKHRLRKVWLEGSEYVFGHAHQSVSEDICTQLLTPFFGTLLQVVVQDLVQDSWLGEGGLIWAFFFAILEHPGNGAKASLPRGHGLEELT